MTLPGHHLCCGLAAVWRPAAHSVEAPPKTIGFIHWRYSVSAAIMHPASTRCFCTPTPFSPSISYHASKCTYPTDTDHNSISL